MVQLISLFYKDRPVETIQNMLRDDIHSSECSEDDDQSQFSKQNVGHNQNGNPNQINFYLRSITSIQSRKYI
jgi:hypothetical protein